ncbi:hypothetical protein ACFLY6_01405 [Candidatus Dependentiae bacterium]
MNKALALAVAMLAVGFVATAKGPKGPRGRKGKDRGQRMMKKMDPEIMRGKHLHRTLGKWMEKEKSGEKYAMSSDLKKAIKTLTDERERIKEKMKELHDKKVEAVKDFMKVVDKDDSEAIKTARNQMEKRKGKMKERMKKHKGKGKKKGWFGWLGGEKATAS